jgi:hypothetical protein
MLLLFNSLHDSFQMDDPGIEEETPNLKFDDVTPL